MARSKTAAHATQSNAVHYDAMQCKEPIKPQEPRGLRDPTDREPKERSRGTQAGSRMCNRISFTNKRRGERGTSREEGRGRSEDTAGRKDERRLGQGRVEGGGTEEGKGARRDRIASPWKRHQRPRRKGRFHMASPRQCLGAPHTDCAPQGAALMVPES